MTPSLRERQNDPKGVDTNLSEGPPLIGMLCWEEGMAPRGLQQLAQLPGNSTNPETFEFPLKYSRIKGADIHTVLENPSRDVLRAMIRAARKMEGEGIRAITTSCGFNAIFQRELSEGVGIPVFTSSLMQVPLVRNMLGRDRGIGVITANGSALTTQHLRNAGIDETVSILVEGLESSAEWNKIFVAPDEDIDIDQVKEDLLRIAISMKERTDIGAYVLECTDLPPFAEAVRKATGRPVFDIVTLVNYVHRALKCEISP